jgi:Mg2+ and Co2+ transporter CorA
MQKEAADVPEMGRPFVAAFIGLVMVGVMVYMLGVATHV